MKLVSRWSRLVASPFDWALALCFVSGLELGLPALRFQPEQWVARWAAALLVEALLREFVVLLPKL